jgi:hypothetical protein
MSMRRFMRLTSAFSKKVENLHAVVALHFAHYDFVRLHKTLQMTPAKAANVSDRLWSSGDWLSGLRARMQYVVKRRPKGAARRCRNIRR